jgi:hypothetical protein
MTEAAVDKRFYLDDLHVGQRFVSRTHLIDAEQIKGFAGQVVQELMAKLIVPRRV